MGTEGVAELQSTDGVRAVKRHRLVRGDVKGAEIRDAAEAAVPIAGGMFRMRGRISVWCWGCEIRAAAGSLAHWEARVDSSLRSAGHSASSADSSTV